MAQYDGSIRINTQINTKNAQIQLSTLENRISKTSDKIASLRSKMDALKDAKIPTKEYKEISFLYEKASKKLDNLIDNQVRMKNTGKDSGESWRKLIDTINNVNKEVGFFHEEMQQLVSEGKAFTIGKDTEEFAKLSQQLQYAEKDFDVLNQKHDILDLKQKNTANGYKKLGNSAKNSIKKIVDIIQKGAMLSLKKLGIAAKNAFSNIDKSSKKSVGLLSALKSRFKGLVLSLLIFNQISKAFNAMTSGIKEGMENLAKYSLSVNSSISLLKSSLTQLKNSFATAFYPIINTVTPILVTFINMISRAVTYVGMLIAALTGQDTFIKAVAVQEDYAASLDKTSNNANKAEKALKRYLSPLDEINRYETDKDTGSGSGSGQNYSGPSPSDMFETVPIENSIKGIADKIKTLVESQDWTGLGGYIADGINLGLQKVYDVISWEKVGPKIEGFVDPFVTTFNSIVDLMDWDKLGKTVGAGIKTITKSVNMLADKIDWVNLGSKIAIGFKGLVNEVDWYDLGHMFGQKFKIAWELFYGFVKDPELFSKLGKAVADGLSGFTETIPFGEIGLGLAYGINDAFDFLSVFARTFPWDTFANNVKNGITNFLEKTNWSENGEKLGEFILHLVETLRMMLDKDTFYKFGKSVGDFLGALPWEEILKEAVGFIIDAFVGLFSGLKDSGNVGKLVSYLGSMFLAIKVANITGIGKLVTLLIKRIVKNFGLSSNTSMISTAIENTIGKGIRNAASNLDGLSRAASKTTEGVSGISSALNGLALGAGIVGTIELTKSLAGMADAAMGGNGYLTELGGGIDGLVNHLKLSKGMTKEQADELFLLKESLEDASATPEEFASKFVEAFGRMGISSNDAKLALQNLTNQVTLSEDQSRMLALIIDNLGESTQTMAEKINMAGVDSEDAYGKMYSALGMLYGQAKITDTQLSYLQTQFELQYPAVESAQEGYELLSQLLQDQGVEAETTAHIIGELFPEAVKTAETVTVDSMSNIDSASSDAMSHTEEQVINASDNIAKGVTNSMALSQKAVEDSTGEIASTTESEWKNSQDSVDSNLTGIEKSTKETMRDVAATVRTYWESVQINTNRVWQEIGDKIASVMSETFTAVNTVCVSMTDIITSEFSEIPGVIDSKMRTIIDKVNATIANINSSIGGIERAFTFSYDIKNPVTGDRSYGNYWMNIPRINSIPRLATGTVVPPNREFMAVLGDNKREPEVVSPLSTIEQAVRNAIGGLNGVGQEITIKVPVYIDGKQIYEAVIKQGKINQMSSGNNDFMLGTT